MCRIRRSLTVSRRAPAGASDPAPWFSEDWLSVVIGLFIFMLALAVLANVDLIGWVVTISALVKSGAEPDPAMAVAIAEPVEAAA